MSLSAQLAFARMHAAHQAFVASYKTPERPAAIKECAAADVEFIAAMPGMTVWVRAEYETSGAVVGQVSMAFDNGDIRTEHGVINWGNFCPSTYSLREAKTFFFDAQVALKAACVLDDAEYVPVAGIQTTLIF